MSRAAPRSTPCWPTRLNQLGAEVRTEAGRGAGLPDNLVAVFHGTGKGKILIIAHIDTVFGPGTAAARPFSMDQERAHGPGVGDEKAGVVNAFTALKILHDMGFKNFATITLLLDDSEERGSPGSTQLIKRLAREHDVEFNMEPGDPPDALTVWRKGSAGIRIQVKGRAAHAGMAPQDGRNAAVELMHQLCALQGAFPTSGSGITVNLTVLRAGERNNIIPDLAEATLNVRYRKPEEFDAILAESRSRPAQHASSGHHRDHFARPRLSAARPRTRRSMRWPRAPAPSMPKSAKPLNCRATAEPRSPRSPCRRARRRSTDWASWAAISTPTMNGSTSTASRRGCIFSPDCSWRPAPTRKMSASPLESTQCP